MAELQKAAGVEVELVEELVKKHFGPQYTSKVAYNLINGRYIPSPLPRRIVAPRTLLGLPIGWKVLGEFSDNIGFRLELWDPTYLRQAEGLTEEYNKKAEGTKLELHPFFMHRPAAGRKRTA